MSDVFKNYLNECLEDAMLKENVPVLLEYFAKDAMEVDWDSVSPQEKDIVLTIKEFGRQLGGDQGTYNQGVLSLIFTNKHAVSDFMNSVENLSVVDDIDDIEIEVRGENLPDGKMEDGTVNYGDVTWDGKFLFTVHVYLNPEIVQYASVDVEVEDTDGNGEATIDDENGEIFEVVRKIKVTSRGKKWVKMQCRPGFKWSSEHRSCQKIGGSALATLRKSVRKSVRTKKSLGTGFKTRVLRKQRRASRFRKSFGLDR